jgi:hypothetical protein
MYGHATNGYRPLLGKYLVTSNLPLLQMIFQGICVWHSIHKKVWPGVYGAADDTRGAVHGLVLHHAAENVCQL